MKKYTAAALVCAMVLSMTACGGNSTSETVSEPAVSESAPAESAPAEGAENNASEDTPAEEIEEIPYVLGGELTPTMIANSRYNVGNQVRLAGVIKKLQAGEEVTVAYLGGSITQGTSAGNDLCYARLTTNWLEEQFPEAKINYVNAGIGATGSYIGVHRADEQVLSHNPDLVFIDFSVNDTYDRMDINRSSYEGLLRKLWLSDSAPALICIAMTQENGTSVQEAHGEICKKYDIPMISYHDAILDVIAKGYIKWSDISDDDIHPNVPGHAVLSSLITNYLRSVIDNIDNISGEESDFSGVSEAGMKYQNAHFLFSANTEPKSLGSFEVKSGYFGGFESPWMVRATDGQFTEEDGIEFEVEAMNIGILYGKLTSNSTKADVYIDGSYRTTLDGDFTGGWGNYVEFAEIATFISEGTHTIKIVPQSKDGAAAFYVSAVALS